MDKKDRSREWQVIKDDPELHEAERARLRAVYEKHKEKERERSRKKYAANKEAHKARMAKWWAAHPEKTKEYAAKKYAEHGDRERARNKEWRDAHPELEAERGRKYREGPKREQWLKSLRYGPHKHYLSRGKYEEIYPRLLVGPCEICGLTGPMKIDHCHEKNVFRGILCDRCNRGIGFLLDSPELLRKAAEYLERV